MNTIKFYEGNHGECKLYKGNKVHEEMEGLINEWRKKWGEQHAKEMERIIWGGDMHVASPETFNVSWRPLAVPQNNEWITFNGLEPNTEYDFDPKTQTLKRTDRPMTTLYKTDNEHLRKAFIEELKELGYKAPQQLWANPILYTKNGEYNKCSEVSITAEEASKTFNLKTQWNEALQHATEQLQPKYKVTDWVITEGYNDEYDGTPLKITHIFYSDMNHGEAYCEFEQGNGNFNIKSIKRLATQEEIEQATRKTFFDWEVTKSKNTTKIGCQTFDNVFLQRLTDAIGELERDVTIEELINELENIGFEYIDPLPF